MGCFLPAVNTLTSFENTLTMNWLPTLHRPSGVRSMPFIRTAPEIGIIKLVSLRLGDVGTQAQYLCLFHHLSVEFVIENRQNLAKLKIII